MHDASADVGSTANTRPARFRRVHHAPRDHARAGVDRRHRLRVAGQHAPLDRRQPLELLGVDHRRARIERDRAAGVAGAAAARDDREAERDAAFHQAAHFVLRVRIEHDERILDAPVGGVGHVRHARETVEGDVALVRVPRKLAPRPLAQVRRRAEGRGEAIDRGMGRRQQLHDLVVAIRGCVGTRHAALVDLAQPVAQRLHELRLAPRIVEQVVLQVGIALDHPDVAQHFEQHARRASRAAFAAQLVQQPPHRRAEQPDHDLAIGVRRVVVRDLAQARCVRAAVVRGPGRVGRAYVDEGFGDGIHRAG